MFETADKDSASLFEINLFLYSSQDAITPDGYPDKNEKRYTENPIAGSPVNFENMRPNGLLTMYAIPEFVISFDITIKQNRDGITLYKHEFIDDITEDDVASGINKRYERIHTLDEKAIMPLAYWFITLIIFTSDAQYNIVKYIFSGT